MSHRTAHPHDTGAGVPPAPRSRRPLMINGTSSGSQGPPGPLPLPLITGG